MNSKKLPGIIASLVSALLLSSPVMAQEWQTIFNGKDLTGWQQLNGKHIWEVNNGMIVGTTVPGEPNGFLCTEKEYGDFLLELEVSIDTLMNNSGVQFRTLSYPDYKNGRVHGYQMEVDPKAQKWSGAIYEEGGNRGWIYAGDQLSPAAKNSFKKDQKIGYRWNKYRILCIGTTIRTWVNDVPAAHLIDARFLRGYIGLQLHANQANDPAGSYKVRFRNIRVQTADLKTFPLDNTFVVNLLPNNLSSQEEKNGYSFLWDGRSTKGWNGPNKSGFPKNAWSIKDGEMSVLKSDSIDSASGSYIVSEKQYGFFEIKFDVKVSKGADSGVKYFVTESEDNRNRALFSLEYQIVDDSTVDITGNHTLGSLTDILESKKTRYVTKRTGEWNQALIKVLPDNHVEYWLNGNKILEYQRGSAEYKDLVSKSKYKDLSKFGMAAKGHILLENNGSEVSYRSIKIKELK